MPRMLPRWHYLIWLLVLLFSFAATAPPVHGQTGFISIDCGIEPGTNYTSTTTGITYVSDEGYIDTGMNNRISPTYQSSSTSRQELTLRSFPNGTRNCYTLKPVVNGTKYLVRAAFLYGNYDGLNRAGQGRTMKFDLYLGPDLWDNVRLSSASDRYWTEIFTVATADYIWVCLVKNGSHVPFISILELRPLKDPLYPVVNGTSSLKLHSRVALGTNLTIRYPDDQYDRIWLSMNSDCWVPITTTETVRHFKGDFYETPQAVLRTAVYPRNTCQLNYHWNDTISFSDFHLSFHFAELVQLQDSDLREFNIFLNGGKWYGPYRTNYLRRFNFYSVLLFGFPKYNFSFLPTANSTLPPILNSVEVYTYVYRVVATNVGDVAAITAIKDYFRVQRNWMGDPCAPINLVWDGLKCSYGTSSSMITTVNLSSSGLSGSIPVDFGNLTAVTYLDLSSNNLTGQIPDSLGQLSSLQYLNLSGNHFNLSSVPQPLLDREKRRLLTLSLGPNWCNGCDGVEGKKKKKISAPVIAISVGIPAVLLVAVLIGLVWTIKRRKSGTHAREQHWNRPSQSASAKDDILLPETSRQFTYAELKIVTKNFRYAIGKGGFGSVYHGYLENGVQVAVKMRSQSSLQGAKEFLAEAQLLTRVHHRNLVSLIGYCKDENCLARVRVHVSRKPSRPPESWTQRLRIALEASQGLEYLHKGCRPPIIHRDVKSSNILLSEKLEAKLADFGLSKAFNNDSATYMTTAVVGTAGYLDPEYHRTNQITEKSDVYSFGVVLLELVTGKPAFLNEEETAHITEWVKVRIEKGDIIKVVDPRLRDDYDASSVWKVVDIAMRCTSSASSQRATMSEVAQQLREVLDLQIAYERLQYGNSTDAQTSSTAGISMSSMMDGR